VEKVFGRLKHLPTTEVVACSRCGGLLLAKADQKTRTCPYCGSKIVLDGAKKVASAEDAFEASKILRKLKTEASAKG
jgi:DNA-directed RNA polymerase subunit RPC12/RpoP